MKTLPIIDLGDDTTLAGAVNGRAKFVELLGKIGAAPRAPVALFLDFRGVDVATASFLRESVFAFKSYMRGQGSTYYPVVANANEVVLEEISTISKALGEVMLTCTVDAAHHVSEIHLVGELDPKQKFTFERVQELQETDANSLMEEYGQAEQTKSTTAWNNRLSSLAGKGIIREFSHGRAKSYRPVLEASQ